MAAMQSRAGQQQQQQHRAPVAGEEPAVANHAAAAARGRVYRRRSVGLDQESWILFAPKQPAQPLLTPAPAPSAGGGAISEQDEDISNPFSTSLSSDSTLRNTAANTNAAAAAGDSWQLVSYSSTVEARDGSSSSSSSAVVAIDETPLVPIPEAGPVTATTVPSVPVTSTSSSRPQTADGTHFRWASLPKHTDSYFFDDSDEEAPSAAPDAQLQQSIYAEVAGEGSQASQSQKIEDGDTDMLSIPSSLSFSERSTSSDAASPRVAQRKHSPRAPVRHRNASTLTEAALEENTRLQEALAAREAALTSGSEEEDANDPDETLLARAPDALSAGIRPSRRRVPLGAVRPPSEIALSVTSSQRSGIKRRHKQAGQSDKGSKRSHTSRHAPVVEQTRRDKGRSSASRERERLPHSLNRAKFSLGQVARQMFAVDEEVLEMMAQPGSLFSQSMPPRQSRKLGSRPTPTTAHGFEAFSAHLASELGDSPYHRQLYTGFDGDLEVEDSGDETETESPVARRSRQRHSSADTVTTDEDPHTTALGLHRSISMASIQHFLIESLYGSLPSALMASERTDNLASLDLSATATKMRSGRSQPGRGGLSPNDRSHSSSELFEQGRESMYESVDSQASSSYWRRLLRSLVM